LFKLVLRDLQDCSFKNIPRRGLSRQDPCHLAWRSWCRCQLLRRRREYRCLAWHSQMCRIIFRLLWTSSDLGFQVSELGSQIPILRCWISSS